MLGHGRCLYRVRACGVCSVRVLASEAEGGDHVQHAAPDDPIALVRVEWSAGACGSGLWVCVYACVRVVGAAVASWVRAWAAIKPHPPVLQ